MARAADICSLKALWRLVQDFPCDEDDNCGEDV